jgi:hypothetical protein
MTNFEAEKPFLGQTAVRCFSGKPLNVEAIMEKYDGVGVLNRFGDPYKTNQQAKKAQKENPTSGSKLDRQGELG